MNGIVIILNIFVFKVINILLMNNIINVIRNVGINVVNECVIFFGMVFGILIIKLCFIYLWYKFMVIIVMIIVVNILVVFKWDILFLLIF